MFIQLIQYSNHFEYFFSNPFQHDSKSNDLNISNISSILIIPVIRKIRKHIILMFEYCLNLEW